MKRSSELLDVMPIWRVERDYIISTYGDFTAVYELQLPELFTLSSTVNMVGEQRVETGDFRELNETWVKAIGVLPDHVILHKQDWFTVEKYEPHYAVNTYLDKASERHFNERPYLAHKCYVYITKTHPHRSAVSSLKTALVSGRLLPKEVMDTRSQEDFLNSIAQFESILTSTRKITMRQLPGTELASEKGAPGLIERYMSLHPTEPIVPLCDVRMGDELMVGHKQVRFFTIADVDDLSEQVYTHNRVEALSSENSSVTVGFATPVSLMLNVDHVYNQYIFKVSKHDHFPKLEQRSREMTALGSFGKANQSNAALIDAFLGYAADTGYSPVRCHFNLMVWTEDKAQLPQIRHQVTSAIARMGVRPRENSSDGPFLFWAGIPGAASNLPDEDKFWTFLPQAICMLNHESVTADDLSTFGLKLVDRLSGKPVLVDLSDIPMEKGWISNRNKFIVGPSGSGKSFFTNHALRSYVNQGSHAVVVDVGDSYEGLCQLLGGRYLTYKPESPIHFNPFFIESRRYPDIEKIEAIKALLLSLWKKEEDKLTRIEETAFSLTVRNYFDRLQTDLDIVPCFNTYYEYIRDEFPSVLKEKGIQDHHFDYKGFMLTMEPFYKGGEYDYLLNSEENLDLTSVPFVVFELDNIKDHPILFPVVTIIIMDTFITKMRQLKGTRKIILIEEAWKAIMKQGMAEYIKYLYKTVRKHFGEAWIVTQEVDDIINSPIVRGSIINNADTKILLDQRKYQNKFTEVKTFLALTERDKNLALSLNRDNDPARRYKEVFVSYGGQHSAVYGVEVSRPEYFAFTTEQREKTQITSRTAANGGNVELAIRDYIDSQP
ncbi:conjugation system TraG family ATPase [Spirosoma oryzae]|uniref:Conjugation system TraG family ATPase n=1 Tax=Spirosoma oryzae TaxID=1469603 RepID=A0A2T0S303_9BACT|nr:TraG family conjugative transposon ATPase [Spirosoma oryzae]PRY27816.1 conjugation system TraG family ATPase [Spirosoma oryzae]